MKQPQLKLEWTGKGSYKPLFPNGFWVAALQAVNATTSCARLSLIQFKVLHRLHYSKAKLSRIFPDKYDDRCARCTQAPCNLTHMYWSCPKLFNFWKLFFDYLKDS